MNGLHTEIEAQFLYENAEQLPDNATIVEMGTWDGRSAAILGLAVEKRGGRVYTIDHYNHSVIYGPGNQYHSLLRTQNNFIDKDIRNVVPLQGISSEIAAQWTVPIELLFIDGDHKYESVKKDIEDWLPKVVQGGVVLFHDYNSGEGVLPAVDEAINEGKLEKGDQVESLLCTKRI